MSEIRDSQESFEAAGGEMGLSVFMVPDLSQLWATGNR